MPRILITGGAGFIGSHLCDRFIAEGDDVICMDNFLTGSADNIAHLIGNLKFKFVQHNVTDYIYVEGKVDAVLHFAESRFADRLSQTSDSNFKSRFARHPQGARFRESKRRKTPPIPSAKAAEAAPGELHPRAAIS